MDNRTQVVCLLPSFWKPDDETTYAIPLVPVSPSSDEACLPVHSVNRRQESYPESQFGGSRKRYSQRPQAGGSSNTGKLPSRRSK